MKRYVDMIVRYTPDGQIIPLAIRWSPEQLYEIDKVLDVRQAASLKAGGTGIRYLCRIQGKERCIWLEEDKWFVDAKEDKIDAR